MKIDKITLDEFLSYELEEINYNNKVYCFSEVDEETIIKKLKSFGLGKSHRYWGVTDNNLFYIENCDIQDISNIGYDTLCDLLLSGYDIIVIEGTE